MRNPGKGHKPMKLADIQKLISKKDAKRGKASRPTVQAISLAAKNFKAVKQQRGRKVGWRKTSKQEDKKILRTFHVLRPPGHGIDSRSVRNALPKKLQKKVCRKTIINRLGEKGFTARQKKRKSDFGPTMLRKRVKFCRKHEDKDADEWEESLQGVGDFKEFTWYPKVLQPRFKRLRASWTYMNDKESNQPAFQRPKTWFKQSDWKKTKKMKIFGLTTSNGKQISFEVPYGKGQFSSAKWAVFLKRRIGPFLKRAFPTRATFNLLLDGEGLLHAPEAKAAMTELGTTTGPPGPQSFFLPPMRPLRGLGGLWPWVPWIPFNLFLTSFNFLDPPGSCGPFELPWVLWLGLVDPFGPFSSHWPLRPSGLLGPLSHGPLASLVFPH